MDLDLSPADRSARDRAAALELDALAASSDEPSAFTRQAHDILNEQSLFDVSTLGATLATIELSRVSASLGAVLATSWNFAAQLVRTRGAADDLSSRALRGAIIGCIAVQETAQSTVSGLPRIEGEGALSSIIGDVSATACAAVAQRAIVFAASDTPAGARLLCVDLRGAGVRRGDAGTSAGLELAAPSSLHFSGMLVSEAALLAAGEAALTAKRATLDTESLLSAAIAVGISRGAFDRALSHVRALGRASTQSTDFALADMATLVDAAELAVTHAAQLLDANKGATAECAGAKLVATRAATKIVHDALGLCSGADTPELRRAYLDAHFLENHYGSEAVQVDRIAGELLRE